MNPVSYQKIGLIFSCNYYGQNRLKGCVNDGLNIKKFLIEKRGFDAGNVTTLFDANMTSSNMWKYLENLVSQTNAIVKEGKIPAGQADTGHLP